ncbi:hypothetical protein NDA10_006015 [Ustilago hordei]|nr:hypothetical protein NDA10_006015 [Ustilago hordei]KAJ1589725.1 hypothetical protein NDA12_000273 [Ustilago hordei]
MVPTFHSGHFSIQVWASIAYNLKTLLVVLPLAPRKKQLGLANQWDPAKNLTAVRYCNWIINGLLWDAITAGLYKDPSNIKHLGYTDEDIHDKDLQQPIDDAYQPHEEQDMGFEGDDITHNSDDDESRTTLTLDKTNENNTKIARVQQSNPGLHPIMITESLQIYNKQLPQSRVLYRFQEKLCCQGRFTQSPTPPQKDASASIITIGNLKPTSSMSRWTPTEFPTVLIITAKLNWEINSINIKQAYLNASLNHDIYLKPPEGANMAPGKAYKLLKSLYGLKQSRHEWHKELDSHLWYLGFFPSQAVPCVYLKATGNDQVIITVYVDNMLIAAPRQQQINTVKQAIIKKWQIKDNGLVTEFLKIKIMCNQKDQTINLDQQAYIKENIDEWI